MSLLRGYQAGGQYWGVRQTPGEEVRRQLVRHAWEVGVGSEMELGF